MAAVAFDTLSVVKRLKAAGFSDDQAEAVTHVVRDAKEADALDRATKADVEAALASTKADLSALEIKLNASLSSLKAELKSDLTASIAESRADIIKWMFGMIGFQTVAILGAVIALARVGVR